jgi:hypothetical protein
MAATQMHDRCDERTNQFDRRTRVGNIVSEVKAVICTRLVSQLVVMIASVVERDDERGES